MKIILSDYKALEYMIENPNAKGIVYMENKKMIKYFIRSFQSTIEYMFKNRIDKSPGCCWYTDGVKFENGSMLVVKSMHDYEYIIAAKPDFTLYRIPEKVLKIRPEWRVE